MGTISTSVHIINGRRYDAISGALLSGQPSKSIDGVHKAPVQTTKPQPISQPKMSHDVSAPKRPTTTRAKHSTRTTSTQPSKTLMRHAVKKPTQASSIKRKAGTQSSTLSVVQHTVTTPQVIVQRTKVYSTDPGRLQRASAAAKHPHVTHFKTSSRRPELPVAVAAHKIESAIEKAVLVPPTSSPAPRSASNTNMFEHALHQATSHQQKPHYSYQKARSRRSAARIRNRMIGSVAGAVAVIALAGAFTFQTNDRVQIAIASKRAGVTASAPGFIPTGYELKNIATQQGSMTLRYAADTIHGPAQFVVNQKSSSWSSDTLMQNIVASANNVTYETLYKDGKTIYVYGKNKAAWLDNGTLYQLAASNNMDGSTFSRLASSL